MMKFLLTTALGLTLVATTTAAHSQYAQPPQQSQQDQTGNWPGWSFWNNPMMQQGRQFWGWGGRSFGGPMMGGGYNYPMMGGYGMPMMGYGMPMMYGYGWPGAQGVWTDESQQAIMLPYGGRIALIDADKDGTISADEAAAAADADFTAMDSDGDGSLTKEEFTSANLGPGAGFNPARVAAMRSAKEQRFGSIDASGDGMIGKDEYLDQAKTQWESADRDSDGQVTPFEHRSAMLN